MLLPKLRGLYVLVTSAVLICSIQAKVFVVEKGIGTKSSAQADSYLNKEGNAWTLNIDIKSFEGNKEKRLPLRSSYYKFEVPGFKLSQKPGQPQLPYQSFLVKGQPSEIEVNVVAEGEKDFENILTMPAPLKSCRCLKDLSFGTESFPLKRESYFQGQDKVVELKYLGDYRGQHITKVIVRPMLQQGNKLKVYKGLEITLESNSSLEVEEFVAQADTMVIVTPQKLLSGAQEFKTFKEETGMSVELFVYEDVARDAATLKTFFHNKYRRDAYQYAVLFGHEEILPSLRVATSSDPQTPSDYPYFVMGGSGDVFPDVFYSRVVANTNREVQNQIKKLREYRDQTWDNAQGVKTAIGIASNEGWDPNDVEYVGQMIDPLVRTIGFNKTDFF
ncbi:MAG: C25 family cysteine peptidase, partial [Halobacteriovoraceae bacterium]|nr:C25 family cysteine peptidase [Halobacteriovoraceae bacterium]